MTNNLQVCQTRWNASIATEGFESGETEMILGKSMLDGFLRFFFFVILSFVMKVSYFFGKSMLDGFLRFFLLL